MSQGPLCPARAARRGHDRPGRPPTRPRSPTTPLVCAILARLGPLCSQEWRRGRRIMVPGAFKKHEHLRKPERLMSRRWGRRDRQVIVRRPRRIARIERFGPATASASFTQHHVAFSQQPPKLRDSTAGFLLLHRNPTLHTCNIYKRQSLDILNEISNIQHPLRGMSLATLLTMCSE